jgi:hypothetical protein
VGAAALEGVAVSAMIRCASAILLVTCAADVVVGADPPKQTVIVVVGAEGAEEFREPFRNWAEKWRAAAELGKAECHFVGLEPESAASDRERLKELLIRHSESSHEPLWLVLIGHGTFNGKVARFNLRGTDVSSGELAEMIKGVSRPLAIADCTSCSAPFLAELSGRSRVIVTATRSGHEYNLTRLGEHLSGSINDPAGDLDKDGQTSLLEAFLLASNRVQEFYASESRLATEHALLDDNGDKLGTPPDWFKGTRAVKSAKDGAQPDGRLANTFVLVRSPAEAKLSPEQRARRDELEQQLTALRSRKAKLEEDEYLDLLQPLLLELGEIAAGTSTQVKSGDARPALPSVKPPEKRPAF